MRTYCPNADFLFGGNSVARVSNPTNAAATATHHNESEHHSHSGRKSISHFDRTSILGNMAANRGYVIVAVWSYVQPCRTFAPSLCAMDVIRPYPSKAQCVSMPLRMSAILDSASGICADPYLVRMQYATYAPIWEGAREFF